MAVSNTEEKCFFQSRMPLGIDLVAHHFDSILWVHSLNSWNNYADSLLWDLHNRGLNTSPGNSWPIISDWVGEHHLEGHTVII